MPETIQKIVKPPAHDQIAKAMDSMSEEDRNLTLLKAALRIPNTETVSKAVGARPIKATPVAPPQMAPVTDLGALTEAQVKGYLASLSNDQLVLLLTKITLRKK